MKQIAFGIYDRAARCYSQPFFQTTRELGMRAFGDHVRREDSVFHAHPEDYEVFALGEYDNEDGSFVSYEKPQFLMSGSEIVAGSEIPASALREVKNG